MSRSAVGHVAGTASGGIKPPTLIALISGVTLIAILFAREIRAAVEVWNASTAYSHCYLILPMTGFLLWERRSILAQSVARPQPASTWLAIPVALAWFASERLGIMEGRQLAAVAGLQVMLLSILGRQLYTRISGPLLFLFFLVPFGAFLTPVLQRFTATFSTIGLDLLSIPNYSDKFIIETPAGVFFVAEACAGLRFLIAAIAFGVFYALLTFTSLSRRITFVALSVVVPIIANGVRALGIVVLGQILGSAQAAAADHIVYGWIFFSLVMVLLIAIGHFMREPRMTCSPVPIDQFLRTDGYVYISVALACVGLLGCGPALAATIDTRSAPPALATATLLQLPEECTRRVEEPSRAIIQRSILECGTSTFSVEIAAFAPRSVASPMVAERRRITQEIGAEDVAVSAAAVPTEAGQWTMVQTTDPNRTTAYASWVDGMPSNQGLSGRLAQARNSVLGAAHAPLLITISSTESPNATPSQRTATLNRLRNLLRAQTDLNRRVAQATRLTGS